MIRRTIPVLVLILALWLPAVAVATEAAAETAKLDAVNSVFAVVTHKAGLAAGMAHEHVVVAERYDAELRFDPEDLESASLELEVPVEHLFVDDRSHVEALAPALLEHGIVGEKPTVPDDKDRKKIRRSMLAEDQLAADSHPTITASAHGLRPADGDGEPTHLATISLTVRGETVEKVMPLTVRFEEGMRPEEEVVVVEGTTTFAFTDFGIEPYSAFFGMVKVADVFHAYVRMVARR